jgi:uncharacterized protein YpmS
MKKLFFFILSIGWIILVFAFLVSIENAPKKEQIKKVENKVETEITSQQINRFMQQRRIDKETQKMIMKHIDENCY